MVLDGDLSMPPTAPWFLPGLLGTAWNAFLAKFVWKTYVAIYVGSWAEGYHIAFRSDVSRASGEAPWKWAVMPQRVGSGFAAFKLGKEICEFAVFNVHGHPVDFTYINRGTRLRLVSEHKEALSVSPDVLCMISEGNCDLRRFRITFV